MTTMRREGLLPAMGVPGTVVLKNSSATGLFTARLRILLPGTLCKLSF